MFDCPSRRLYGRFALEGRTFVGEVDGGDVREVNAASMAELIMSGPGAAGATHPLASLRVLAPLERPTKIVCVGLNYRAHILEMGDDVPKEPLIFSKPSSSIIGPEDAIVLPPASKEVDYEGECAIVIGRRASCVKDGSRYIFGYTGFNDVTARDLQKKDPDWTRAKGFDTFAPTGPFVSTRRPLEVTTRLNGRVVQHAPMSDRVFQDATLVEFISTIMTLEPGDLIPTGTPSGVSAMNDGHVVEVELDDMGALRNRVIKSM